MAASLTMLSGKHAGRSVPLSPKVQAVIGRNDDCNVRLRTELVSRHHCVVEYSHPDWVVRDLGSSNGTFVNGTRVLGPTTISNGDRLSIGPIHFQVAVEWIKQEPDSEELDQDSGIIAGWLAEEGASPIKKTTVLSDEQRAALQDLAGNKPKAPVPKAPVPKAPSPGVPVEALNALRRMQRGS
jgi:pSer/pThr/pTyr-binding forkhead associated (FHA) protein